MRELLNVRIVDVAKDAVVKLPPDQLLGHAQGEPPSRCYAAKAPFVRLLTLEDPRCKAQREGIPSDLGRYALGYAGVGNAQSGEKADAILFLEIAHDERLATEIAHAPRRDVRTTGHDEA